jgi:hypothetical protein
MLVVVMFAALTSAALWQGGRRGIVEPHFQSFGGGQVFADLILALSLALIWM